MQIKETQTASSDTNPNVIMEPIMTRSKSQVVQDAGVTEETNHTINMAKTTDVLVDAEDRQPSVQTQQNDDPSDEVSSPPTQSLFHSEPSSVSNTFIPSWHADTQRKIYGTTQWVMSTSTEQTSIYVTR